MCVYIDSNLGDSFCVMVRAFDTDSNKSHFGGWLSLQTMYFSLYLSTTAYFA